jgi:acetyl esterase/lipase
MLVTMKQLAIGLSVLLGFSFWAAAADHAGAAACDSPRVTRDLEYVEEPASDLQELDVYGFEREGACGPVPVVVYVHGGGWRRGDKQAVGEKATFFNDLGYVFVSVNYRLSAPPGEPDRPIHPAHSDDVGAAIAWVEANIEDHGGNGEHLALIGHSAGAHLVALVGLDDHYVDKAGGDPSAIECVISNDAGAYDLLARRENGPLASRLVANAFGTDEAILRDASPITHADDGDNDPPDFLVVRRGSIARQGGQERFADALQRAGGDVTILDATTYTHGEVNQMIGVDGDTVMTPPIEEFTRDCLS